MPWFCILNSRSSCQQSCCARNRIPPKRNQCSCRLKITLMLVLLSAYCISSLHAHRQSSSSPSFIHHPAKSATTAFVTNENDSIRWQQHSRRSSSRPSSELIYRTHLTATNVAKKQSSTSSSLLLMASTTSSSAETTQPNNNRQQQTPPTQPLISKSKIDSQIEQLENKQNVQKQQQKQRYHKKKGTESQPSSSSTTTSKKKRTSKKKHRSNNHNNKQRCSIAQNKKRQVRHLYTKAKQLEKRGSWREASDMY